MCVCLCLCIIINNNNIAYLFVVYNVCSPTSSDYPAVGGVYTNVSTHKTSRHISHQRLYYVFDPQLILPEYSIIVKYLIVGLSPSLRKKECDDKGNECFDSELIEMKPKIETRPKLAFDVYIIIILYYYIQCYTRVRVANPCTMSLIIIIDH